MNMENENKIGPSSEKQKIFLNSTSDITIFGGAMGSGKSYLGVMAFLPYIHLPKFRGLITRRTTPELKGIGGIFDVAKDMYALVDPKVKWKDKESKFVFSSGAEIALRHFEHEKNETQFQGLAANLILVDEAQHYTEKMVLFLLSRNRNPRCPECRPRLLLTCNPDRTSFLRKWVDWWLTDKGFPDLEKDCQERYHIRKDGGLVWADNPLDLTYIDPVNNLEVRPKSVKFISANIYDNPVLMRQNPDYVNNLQGMRRVEKEKYLYGGWDAQETGSGYWKPEWCEIVDSPPLSRVKMVRSWDLAGTLPSETNPSPDWSVGTLMSKDKYGQYYIEDCVRFRARAGELFQRILATAKEDGDDVLITIPQDPNASGKAYAMSMIRELAESGYYAKAKATNQSKITRFAPFCAASETGHVKIVRGEWNDMLIDELTIFDGSRRNKDDIVDSVGDCFMMLASSIKIPSFSPPSDMTKTNQFDF